MYAMQNETRLFLCTKWLTHYGTRFFSKLESRTREFHFDRNREHKEANPLDNILNSPNMSNSLGINVVQPKTRDFESQIKSMQPTLNIFLAQDAHRPSGRRD